MKSFALATAAFCSVASAVPFSLAPWSVQNPPQPGTQLYQFQSKSSVAGANNQWVSLKTGSTQYGLASSQAAATKFFVNLYKPTGTYAIHNADDTRQVALQGANSAILNVVDVTNPSSDNIPGGQLMEWATFTLDNNLLGVKDGSTLPNRTFAAVPVTSGSGYNLAFYDGLSKIDASILFITLNVVKST